MGNKCGGTLHSFFSKFLQISLSLIFGHIVCARALEIYLFQIRSMNCSSSVISVDETFHSANSELRELPVVELSTLPLILKVGQFFCILYYWFYLSCFPHFSLYVQAFLLFRFPLVECLIFMQVTCEVMTMHVHM